MPPSYRERLRTEGFALAACGAIGSAAPLIFVPESRRRPPSTIGQLIALALLLEWLGTRAVRRSVDEAQEVDDPGSGEPTPLWVLPPIVAGLAGAFIALPKTGLPFSDLAGADAGLRGTGGCVVVGLAQAGGWGGGGGGTGGSRGVPHL